MQYQQVPDNGKGLGIGAMVCSIIGIVACMTPILAIILGVVGIVLGNMARKKLPAGQPGMATAGFVCDIIEVALWSGFPDYVCNSVHRIDVRQL